MNFNFFISVIGISLLLAFRGFFAYAIYLYCKPREQLNSDLLIKLSFFFPFATGLFCLFKGGAAEENREHRQSIAAFFASLIFLVASFASRFYLYNNWYNIMGRVYAENAKVKYYDRDNNTYSYRFEKNGYDYLFINDTDERLVTDLCYLDADGYFVYDDNNEFVRQEDGEYHFQYIGGDGQIYYWASDMHWDENAYLCDSNNKIVK